MARHRDRVKHMATRHSEPGGGNAFEVSRKKGAIHLKTHKTKEKNHFVILPIYQLVFSPNVCNYASRVSPFWWEHPATGFAKPGGVATPSVCERRTSILNFYSPYHLRLSGTPKYDRTGKQALQFYFAAQLRFLCEDVVFRAKYISRPSIWPCLVFSELLFQSVAAKKNPRHPKP